MATIESAEVKELADEYEIGLRLDHDTEAPMPWAVWAELGPEQPGEWDIAGAGESASEAIAEARATLRGWAENAR